MPTLVEDIFKALRGFAVPAPPGTPRESIVVNNVTVRPIQRRSQNVQSWRTALSSAEGISQQRGDLYDLYEDILLDAHLCAVVGKRVDAIANRQLLFTGRDGKAVPTITDLQERSFFADLLTHVVSTPMWGHSLLELFWPAPGSDAPGQTVLVPRAHVKPRFGIVCKNSFDLEGIDYKKDPTLQKRLIEVGSAESLGRLIACCFPAIIKRGDFGDWAEFAEMFGMPFRWATYRNEATRTLLEEALSKMGSAGYAVGPEDANLQYFNGNVTGQGGDIFRMLYEACNNEMSIAVLGNTMTTSEAKHSGYAQSVTHAETQEEVHAADRKLVLRVLNEQLIPYLVRIGYRDADGGRWAFADEERLSLAQRIDVDTKLAAQIRIPPEYWYDRYHIPMPADGILEPEKPEAPDHTGDPEEDQPQPSRPKRPA